MSNCSFYAKVVKTVKIPGVSQEYLSKMPGMTWIPNMKFVLSIHVGFYHMLNRSGVIFSYKFVVAYISLHIHFRGDKIAGLEHSIRRTLTLYVQ